MKAGLRNRCSGSIGSFTRVSIARNAIISTVALASSETIRVEPQPSSLPRRRPSTSRNRELENVTSPSQSMREAFGSRLSRTRSWVIAIAAMPIGTFRKKIDSQPTHSVSTPPTSGPTATAMPIVAPYTPIAMPRSRPALNSCAISASETANITAPPTPWNARARLRKVGSVARPASSEPSVKMPRPAVNTRRRPSRSASTPAVSTSAARGSV